jgi:glycosyltransferase involved in cell wall biosynthesis
MGRGGAEVMLVKLLKELTEYNNIVVTLNPQNHFSKEEFICDSYYCLNMGSFARFPLAVIKLKAVIKKNKIDLVHSHLFSATLVARLATPESIPLITTIHTNIAASTDYKKWYLKALEKMSYRRHPSTIIGVSKTVMEQYFTHFNHIPYRQHLLYTFVDVNEIQPAAIKKENETGAPFRLIAIGALRYPKNQQYLVKAFEQLKNENIELHIYGIGVQQQELEQAIAASHVKVILKGEVKGAAKLMQEYDVYVMSSEFEGFSLSVLEAMAMQMPMLLSDIPSFREQCADTALFFNLKDTGDFIDKLLQLKNDKNLRQQFASAAKDRVMNNFTLQHHLRGLRNIYHETIDKH